MYRNAAAWDEGRGHVFTTLPSGVRGDPFFVTRPRPTAALLAPTFEVIAFMDPLPPPLSTPRPGSKILSPLPQWREREEINLMPGSNATLGVALYLLLYDLLSRIGRGASLPKGAAQPN